MIEAQTKFWYYYLSFMENTFSEVRDRISWYTSFFNTLVTNGCIKFIYGAIVQLHIFKVQACSVYYV